MSRKLASALICVALIVLVAFAAVTWLGGERRPPWIWFGGGEPHPPWDDQRARSFVGKNVVVGLTYEKPDGSPLRHEQVHGRISVVDRRKGFCVVLEGVRKGQVYWLPPDLRPFQEAAPGDYRLRSTGEVIVDPDLLATWIVNSPKKAPTVSVAREC